MMQPAPERIPTAVESYIESRWLRVTCREQWGLLTPTRVFVHSISVSASMSVKQHLQFCVDVVKHRSSM